MILKYPNTHLTDQELYTHAKFRSLLYPNKYITETVGPFGLYELRAGTEEIYNVFSRIYMTAQVLGLDVRVTTDYKFDEDLKDIQTEIEKNSPKKKKELHKILEKIQEGSLLTIEEVGAFSWVWFRIYSSINFLPQEETIPSDITDIMDIGYEKYLEDFINNELIIARKNYYRFEAQKRTLIQLIQKKNKIELYGNNFIIQEDIDDNCINVQRPDFCLLHTALALQKLGYFTIVDFWHKTSFPKENSGLYVNVILNDIFVEEVNTDFKKTNPSIVLESYDTERCVLKFAGHEIKISKKAKKTDAVLLLQTLLENESADWMYNDEILENWGHNPDDQKDLPKNKVYFAAQKINNPIALETQIDDFIEYNTTCARINPKYRPTIDE